MESIDRLDDVLAEHLPEADLEQVRRILYGWNRGAPVEEVDLQAATAALAEAADSDIHHYRFQAAAEEERAPRKVKIALIQNSITNPTTDPLKEQCAGIRAKVEVLIDAAAAEGVNVLCLQEAWTMPFAFCTREKQPWLQFAEDANTGPNQVFLKKKAKQHNMVIVSPILERDNAHAGTIWNTAVIIGNNGNVIGKSRKNHIPRVGDFNESTYYMESQMGHPVFETAFGRIGVNICYGRHHPLNWMAYGLNGAEIVFNPSATVGALSEPMWGIEQRNAAIANNYFVGAINRLGTESFPNAFTSGNGRPAHKDFGHFYGSSYIASPDASRTPALSRLRDGLIVAEVDLNLCRQVKDSWGLSMTARYEMYADFLNRYIRDDFQPQIVRDPSLSDSEPLATQPRFID